VSEIEDAVGEDLLFFPAVRSCSRRATAASTESSLGFARATRGFIATRKSENAEERSRYSAFGAAVGRVILTRRIECRRTT